jgi:hypothetical protein
VNQKVRDESFMKAGEEGKKNNVSIRSCQVRRKVRLSSREEKNQGESHSWDWRLQLRWLGPW